MYSPHSDLYKMVHTPSFIVFKVKIEDKEYFGRPNTITVNEPFTGGNPQSGMFTTYSSVQSFMQGSPSGDIAVNSTNIIGLEAIDTKGEQPLDDILSICNELSNIPDNADIGIIRKNIPEILNRLLIAFNDYELLHECKRYEAAYDDVEETISKCQNALHNLDENKRIDLIEYSRGRVSTRVCNLIEFSGEK